MIITERSQMEASAAETATPPNKFELSDLDEDADIDVMTEVQSKEPTLEPASENEAATKNAEPPATEPPPQDTPATQHERGGSWSGYLRKKMDSFKSGTTQKKTEAKKRDWSKEHEALAKLKTSAVTTLNQMGHRFNEGGVYLYEASKRTAQATAENLKKIRLFKSPIEVVCRQEATQRPCPRLLLVCCTSIAATGLGTEDVFRHDAPEELIHAVSAHFLKDSGAVLPPSGATPEVLASVVKKFLMDLDEPLLTYGLLDQWIQAGAHPQIAKEVLGQLPPANLNSMELLLDCLNRIASNASENGMDPDALAEAMAPCLLWRLIKPTAKKVGITPVDPESVLEEMDETPTTDPSSMADSSPHDPPETVEKFGKVPLEGADLQNLIHALSHLIANGRSA